MEKTYAILDKDDIVVNLVVMLDPLDINLLKQIISSHNALYSIKYSTDSDKYEIEINDLVRYNLENSNPVIGYKFTNGLFYPPKPYDNWIWNDLYHEWAPPLPQGSIDDTYQWNPNTEEWDKLNV